MKWRRSVASNPTPSRCVLPLTSMWWSRQGSGGGRRCLEEQGSLVRVEATVPLRQCPFVVFFVEGAAQAQGIGEGWPRRWQPHERCSGRRSDCGVLIRGVILSPYLVAAVRKEDYTRDNRGYGGSLSVVDFRRPSTRDQQLSLLAMPQSQYFSQIMGVVAVAPARTEKFIRTKTCLMRSSNPVGSVSADTTSSPWVLWCT